MALDLFANFERTRNSSVFYRLTSGSPYTVSIKLSDLQEPDENYSISYKAQSAINNGPFSDFSVDGNGYFITSIQWDVSTPCVCSISVSLSTILNEYLDTFSVSGIFLSSIPTANFIAYPTNVVFRDIDDIVKVKTLNSTNFNQSSGVFFYGEGHTEVINLSSNCASQQKALWYIGNPLSAVRTQTSYWEVTGNTNNSLVSSTITSDLDIEKSLPISLLITNDKILSSAPIYTYDDSTGEISFYSYFSSSLSANGEINPNNTLLKNNIDVRNYPLTSNTFFRTPFLSPEIDLPIDYSYATFLCTLSSLTGTGILTEQQNATMWMLSAGADEIGWDISTALLSGITGYQFQLAYYNNEQEDTLPFFNAFPTIPTNATLRLSAFKTVSLEPSGGPTDWIAKDVVETKSFHATIQPLPTVKLYFSNYFVEKNTASLVHVIPTTLPPYTVQSVTLSSSYSPASLSLNSSELTGTMTFDQTGLVDITTSITIVNSETLSSQTINTLFQNVIEVVDKYDEIDTTSYQTQISPLTLSYTEQPKITPNEWVTANNVNSVIVKFYTILQELDRYTNSYELKSLFYSWTGPKLNSTNSGIPIYVWQDLECPDSVLPEQGSWAEFECSEESFLQSNTWEYHECEQAQTDPTCLQKYCIEWKWKSRQKDIAEVDVTWKDAKQTNKFAKKWKFEKCDLSNVPLNCDRGYWKTSTFDVLSFPIPSCSSNQRCKIVDLEHLEATNHLVIAYPTELNLVKNNYYSTLEDNESRADSLFSFQNIVGLTTNSEGKVIVLDSILSKVSIFRIIDNDLKLFNAWGSFGLKTTPQGFNQPQDIHIDQQNSIWVTDTGNKCVKKLTINGKYLATIDHEHFQLFPPKSTCVDSQLNTHVLTENKVIVFDSSNNYIFEYQLESNVTDVSKINTSYNRECIYITYNLGVVKYFRTGTLYGYIFNKYECEGGQLLAGYNSITQDKFRNVYITAVDKLLKVPDIMKITETKAPLNVDLFWDLNEVLIDKEEYVQPWVYLRAFHRLWDNIELLRNSLFYDATGKKSFKHATYSKNDLVIGQNEIVTNAVINRLTEQLWINLQSIIDYFAPIK